MDSSEKPRRGRPRDENIRQAILRAALDLVSAKGFRAITVDQIAARAGTGKMALYRRWPNKATVVMDALLEWIGPETDFPPAADALESLQQQLRLQAKFFRSRHGRLIRSLLAEAQSDQELAHAFRDCWIRPRREGVIGTLRQAIQEGNLRDDLDVEVMIDTLYGPIYYRLLLGTGPIDAAFIEELYRQFLVGHQRSGKKNSK